MRKVIHHLRHHLRRLTVEESAERLPPKKQASGAAKSTEPTTVSLDIPATTILKVMFIGLAFVLGLEILVQVQGILTSTVIAFFLAIGLGPIVSQLEKHHWPRPVAILFLYLVFFGILALLLVGIVPILADQSQRLAQDFSQLWQNHAAPTGGLGDFLANIAQWGGSWEQWLMNNASSVGSNIQGMLGSTLLMLVEVFQGVFNFVFTLVLLFFILLEREIVGKFFLQLWPARQRKYLESRFLRVQQKVMRWFRAQAIMMVSVGVFVFVGMKFLEWTVGMEYAASIAILAAFMELIPYVGVTVVGLVAVLVALNISWLSVVGVIVWIAITQFLEGNVLLPVVMEKVIGLSSVSTILAVAIGGVLGYSMGGFALSILAMVLSVPTAAIISLFLQEYINRDDA